MRLFVCGDARGDGIARSRIRACSVSAASGADPTAHAFAATSWTLLCWQGVNVVLTVVMVAYTMARLAAGKLDTVRRATFDSTWLVWLYTSAQGLAMLAIS